MGRKTLFSSVWLREEMEFWLVKTMVCKKQGNATFSKTFLTTIFLFFYLKNTLINSLNYNNITISFIFLTYSIFSWQMYYYEKKKILRGRKNYVKFYVAIHFGNGRRNSNLMNSNIHTLSKKI